MEHLIKFATEAVEETTGIPFSVFSHYTKGKISRKAEYVLPRRLLTVILRDNTTLTINQIGEVFKDNHGVGQNHSTIIKSIIKHNNYVETDKKYHALYLQTLDLFFSKVDHDKKIALLNSPEYRAEVKEKLNFHMKQAEQCINQLKSAI